MNMDPLEELEGFYAACRVATEPVAPRRFRFAVPALGTSLGIALAVAIASFPSEESAAQCERAVRALAAHQLASPPPPNEGARFISQGRGTWTV
jgi:hypothetical protein